MPNYHATKIPLLCNEDTVRQWAGYMLQHLDEVASALRVEGVRHEMWLLGKDDALFVIGVMDVDEVTNAAVVPQKSRFGVDEVHKRFKAHWDSERAHRLAIDTTEEPTFPECELLFEARG